MNTEIHQDKPPRRQARAIAPTLAWILCLAIVVRLAAIFAFPNLHFPDENYQLYEQGHRLAFGYGVKPWEFEDGLRSYVVPYGIALLFRLSEPIFGGPQGYLWFTQIAIATLSLAPVVTTYNMGRRISATHALMAGLATATWFEIVYFSSKPLTEALAADFVLMGLAMASPSSLALSARRLAAIGACLGAAAMLRIHLAPGLAFVVLWTCRLELRRWLWLVAGAAPVLALFGAVDWATWGAPFVSFVRAFSANISQGKASGYGVSPPYFYLLVFLAFWYWAMLPMLLLIARRIRSSTAWIGFSVIVIAVHSAIPHKEYRFIFPALASLVVVAGLGAADFIESARARFGERPARRLTWAAAIGWIATSAALAGGPYFAGDWVRQRGLIQAEFAAANQPDLCGLAIYDGGWDALGGYAFLHRNVPIYSAFTTRPQILRSTQAFNVVALKRSSLGNFQGAYRPIWCASDRFGPPLCVAKRPGPCVRVPGFTPMLDLRRLGEAVPGAPAQEPKG